MGSRFLDHVRRNTRKNGVLQITSKSVLLLLAIVSMVASSIYWWGVQSELTTSRPIALAFTAILVLAPPTLISFLIPWSPAGMLLQRVNAQTWGHIVVIGASIYLVYYSFQLQYSWWAAQRVTAESGLIFQQVMIGLIGFILIPALLWAPVSSEELTAQVEQAHIVKRYELQAQADIAILRSTLLRAQEKALIGFANLTVDEREELAGVMRFLVGGIDKTLREVGHSVKALNGATLHFDELADNQDIQDVMGYIGESLTGSLLHTNDDHSVKLQPPDETTRMRDLSPRESARAIDRAVETAIEARALDASGRAEERSAPYTQSHQTARAVAATRSDSLRYAEEYRAARAAHMPAMWNWRHLSPVLGDRPERTCRDIIDAWKEDGFVRAGSNGFVRFTESGAA